MNILQTPTVRKSNKTNNIKEKIPYCGGGKGYIRIFTIVTRSQVRIIRDNPRSIQFPTQNRKPHVSHINA